MRQVNVEMEEEKEKENEEEEGHRGKRRRRKRRRDIEGRGGKREVGGEVKEELERTKGHSLRCKG